MSDQTVMITIVITYIAILLGIGYYWMRRSRTSSHFLMANRQLGPVLLTSSLLATLIGIASTVGTAGVAYKSGWAGYLYGVGGGIGMITLAYTFTNIRRYNFMTMAEEIASYYGGNRLLLMMTAILVFSALICWTGIQVKGAGLYLNVITGMDIQNCIIIAGLGFAIYVILGGYMAVIYTDLIQAIVLYIGIVALSIVVVVKSGGWNEMMMRLPEANRSILGIEAVGWKHAINIVAGVFLLVMLAPGYRHRIYTGRNEKILRNAFLICGVLYFVFTIFSAIIGMGAYTLNPNLADIDQALPYVAKNLLPVFFASIIIVAGLSAGLSSGDSSSFAAVVYFVRHIYPLVFRRFPVHAILTARVAAALIFTLGVYIVLQFQSIVQMIVTLVAFLNSGLLASFVMGKFWKKSTWQGAVGAIIAGILASSAVTWIPSWTLFWERPTIPAIIAAFAACYIISLITYRGPKPPVEEIAKQFEEERLAIDKAD